MTVQRGFEVSEYRARLGRAQDAMRDAGIAALLLTTDVDIRYFSGFLTRFWESPTRTWYLVVPAQGDPIAVIPSIGESLMRKSWISDIRTWPAPDYGAEGIPLLAKALSEVVPAGETICVPSGHETHLRMPLAEWDALQTALPKLRFARDGDLMRRLRLVKSEAEIEKIQGACRAADRAFARVPEIAHEGTPLSEMFRRFQILCLEEGADWVPYLAGASAPGGYSDVISPATDDPLRSGDILMLDTGLVRDGYFCDFDRNFAVGRASGEVATAHARLIEATAAAFEGAKPGMKACELFKVMHGITGSGEPSEAGRYGHGLGMQLTEPPSLHPADHTILEAGMVLTLEPVIMLGEDRLMVHEENIVLREGGAEWLSTPATAQIPELG